MVNEYFLFQIRFIIGIHREESWLTEIINEIWIDFETATFGNLVEPDVSDSFSVGAIQNDLLDTLVLISVRCQGCDKLVSGVPVELLDSFIRAKIARAFLLVQRYA